MLAQDDGGRHLLVDSRSEADRSNDDWHAKVALTTATAELLG